MQDNRHVDERADAAGRYALGRKRSERLMKLFANMPSVSNSIRMGRTKHDGSLDGACAIVPTAIARSDVRARIARQTRADGTETPWRASCSRSAAMGGERFGQTMRSR
jgi:hypothetical protein